MVGTGGRGLWAASPLFQLMPTKAKPVLFTPRTREGQRLQLFLSKRDWQRFSSLGRKSGPIDVADVETGGRYLVSRADCGADCFCDAVAEPFASDLDLFEEEMADTQPERLLLLYFRLPASVLEA